MSFWVNGPPFLSISSIVWPENPCQSVTAPTISAENGSFFDISRHSSFQKLIRIFAYMYLFVFRASKRNLDMTDARNRAKIHLILMEQRQHFSVELLYLKSADVLKLL